MGDGASQLQEIVSADQVGRLFAVLAIAAPLLGAVIGYFLGVRRGHGRQGLSFGVLIGMIGPANWLLWRLYNLLTDRMGLDTVLNFVVNLTLFAALGVVSGLVLGRYTRGRSRKDDAELAETSHPDH